jgi:hypothetical protein
MHHRTIATAILALGAVAVPTGAAHAQRQPAPWSDITQADDLAAQTPTDTSVDNAERVRAALERVLALSNGSIDLTTRYRTAYDTSGQAARNRSAIEDLRRGTS